MGQPVMALLTTTQAAERLGVDPSHLRRLILDKKLPATKYGKTWLIDAKDLAALPPKSRRGRPRKE